MECVNSMRIGESEILNTLGLPMKKLKPIAITSKTPRAKYSIPQMAVPSLPSFHGTSGSNNKFQKERPLKQNSRELSFKGLSLSNVKVDDASAILKKVSSVLGNTFEKKYAEVSEAFSDRVIKNGAGVEFVRKSIPKMVLESLAYPFVKMPFDLADFGLKLLKKVPLVGNWAKKAYDSKFLTSKRIASYREEEFNAVMGMFDQVSKKMKSAKGADIDDWIFNLSQKYFNPATGKYNSVHERSLNRIVSGFIPAFFLANDAYNLSRFCDDNPDLADKEHNTRFKQELSRVGITAYIQLVILGGLTKFVNSSLMGTALSSTVPVLISETSSRLMNGKSITFISKEKAKQMAKEQGVISTDNKSEDKNDLIYKYYPLPVAFMSKNKAFTAFKGNLLKAYGSNSTFASTLGKQQNPSMSASFAPDNLIDQTAGLVGMATSKRDTENRKDGKTKGLLTVEGLKKAIIASIAIGFGLKFARKNKAVEGAMNSFFGFFKKKYDKLVKQDFVIEKADFNDIITKLKTAGFDEVASRYENLILKHAKESANGAYILGKTDKKIKPAVDFVIAPFRFVWATLKFPYTIVNNVVGLIAKDKKPQKAVSTLDIMTKSIMDLKDNAKKLSSPEFRDYISKTMCASFNNTTKSDYSNADLAKLTKLFASTVTTWFLIADDYNMVMMKSLSQDNAGASLKAKERFQQRITGIFYQTLFIDLFNNTFKKLYHASLLGMSAVTAACTSVCEVFTRKSIGKPVGRMSRDEINELEYRNVNAPGMKGKYFRFMTELTGKKAVSADAKKKQEKAKAKV